MADDGPLFAAVNAVNARVKPARTKAEAEIDRRYFQAAQEEEVLARFGPERAPRKTAIWRYWRQLGLLFGAQVRRRSAR